ncbi:putative zinc protease [Collimonas arenae]|uniref:Putative zinc protease n=1 Tax=Collimonas arenae TaxID=279058 RepID=A0A127QGJ5_9BURK|nr:pitrilysin family protein [Collimonas arenae]AMP09188.1 putative zinc protease [Collimonas arenae]
MHLFRRQWSNRLLSCLLAATCSIGFTSFTEAATTLPAGVTQGPSAEGITEYQFANGFKVLLFPDSSKPTVTVNMTYLVGSRFENYGETGMAHLLEHLMFKGTPSHPSIPKDFSQRGMSFNGTTNMDRTNYFEIFQAGDDNLKWAIDMEADRMLHSFIARKDLDSEMTVVRNEYEQGENSPFGVLIKRLQGVAYDWHNYGKPTIGNRSDIENVKIENLQAFYKTYYQPDNAVLLIAGKFDPAKTLAWVNQAFGKMPKPARKMRDFWTVEPTQDGERSITVRRQGDVQIVAVAYKIPSELHPDSDAISYAGTILADTPNGRLHKSLVETGKATAVFNYEMTGYAPGLEIIAAVVKKGEPIEPVRQALIDGVEQFAKTPPTPEEMERVRLANANGFEKLLNDHQKVGVAMSSTIALGDWRLLFLGRDRSNKVTSEQVAAAAAHYFTRDNRTVGMFLPEDQPQRADVPAAPSVVEVLKEYKPQQAIADGEAFDPSQANIDARTQRSKVGGLKLALLPKKTRGETVSVKLDLLWGDEKSLFGKKTASELADAMLMRGSSTLTREQLADEFSKLKISGSLTQFQTTRSNLPAALQLVASVLKHPRFDPAEFERMRKEALVGLEASRNEPSTLASEAIAAHFNQYPQGHWLAAQSIDQQIASINATSLADVSAFHHDFYGASQGELAIVGDFDVAAVTKVIQDEFGTWQSAAPYARVIRHNFDVAPMQKVINSPDKENGFYVARLNLDMRDDDADYPAMMVANYLFGGGGLKSRLVDRVRQKEGLSYGIGSSLDISAISRAARFSIQAISAPQNLNKVDQAVKEELARVIKDGFSADELARAKSGILQENQSSRSQDSALSAGWARLLDLDRTFAWSKQIEDKISALTLNQVNEAFRKRIDPSQLSVVIVRDEAKAKANAVATTKP